MVIERDRGFRIVNLASDFGPEGRRDLTLTVGGKGKVKCKPAGEASLKNLSQRATQTKGAFEASFAPVGPMFRNQL
jgi:hypothetical protein